MADTNGRPKQAPPVAHPPSRRKHHRRHSLLLDWTSGGSGLCGGLIWRPHSRVLRRIPRQSPPPFLTPALGGPSLELAYQVGPRREERLQGYLGRSTRLMT